MAKKKVAKKSVCRHRWMQVEDRDFDSLHYSCKNCGKITFSRPKKVSCFSWNGKVVRI